MGGGGGEALDRAWFLGRVGGRGETTNSGVVICGEGDNRKLYSLPHDRDVDDAPLIGMQTPNRPERHTKSLIHGAHEEWEGWTDRGSSNIDM